MRHPRRLCLVCASTAAGARTADRWRDLAASIAIPVDSRALPAGCALRDVSHSGGTDGAADVLAVLGQRRSRAMARASQRHAPTAQLGPWNSERSGLAQDLATYLGERQNAGRNRDDCRRIATQLAVLWHFCTRQGLRTTASIEREHIERLQAVFLSDASDQAVTPGTRARVIAAIRGFLRWALATERTPRDLTPSLAVARRPASVPPRVLGAHDIERALAAISLRRSAGLRDRAMLEVLYATGIRRGELVGLDIEDVDAEAGVLRIRRGKGGTVRLVPLGARAVYWVLRYAESARPLHLADLREPALFVSRRGRRITAKQVTGRMHACWIAAGLSAAGSCHVVRHSVATLMHDRGADIRDLQALLGHALLTSTQLYTRVSMQRLHEVYRRTHPGARLEPDVSASHGGR